MDDNDRIVLLSWEWECFAECTNIFFKFSLYMKVMESGREIKRIWYV